MNNKDYSNPLQDMYNGINNIKKKLDENESTEIINRTYVIPRSIKDKLKKITYEEDPELWDMLESQGIMYKDFHQIKE